MRHSVWYDVGDPMQPFPFADEEWATVRSTALSLVNADLIDDDIARASHFNELTEADFTDEDGKRNKLYRQAFELARRHNLPTDSLAQALRDAKV